MDRARTTFTLDRRLAEQARRLNINVPAAALAGVRAAVRDALARADRDVHRRNPERPHKFWDEVRAWGDE